MAILPQIAMRYPDQNTVDDNEVVVALDTLEYRNRIFVFDT